MEVQINEIEQNMDLPYLESAIEERKQMETAELHVAVNTTQDATKLYKYRKKLHKVLCASFSTRFDDLSKLIPDFEIYALVAKHLSINPDIKNSELLEHLTQQQQVQLNLGLTTTLGPPLEDPAFIRGCDLQLRASKISKELSQIATHIVSQQAPNLSNLVGPETASMLITYAGGLDELGKAPSCNIQKYGSKKVGLMGFSSRNTNNQGLLYQNPIVMETPPEQRTQAFRDLSNKVALVGRIDAQNSYPDGSKGNELKENIKTRLEKIMNNVTPKYVRPLPIPGIDDKKVFRGGRQKRANKKKFGLGEELTARQKVAFGVDGQYDELGVQYGVTALDRYKKQKSSTNIPFQKKIEKKLQGIDKKFK